MDTSSLERIASSLESSLDSWEFWLAASTLTVVVGLVLEYWYEVRKLASERPFRWKSFQELMGAVLVTIGVAGELLIQSKASKIEAAIRDVNHKVEASLNKQAADAKREAAEANERTARLLAALADRDLDPEQQRRIGERCAKFEGQTVQLRSYPNDLEAARLIVALKAAFEPRIHVADRTGELTATWGDPDMVLGIHVVPSQRSPGFAQALVTMLRTDGRLTVADLPAYGSGSDTTDILVGMKPVVLAKEAVKGK